MLREKVKLGKRLQTMCGGREGGGSGALFSMARSREGLSERAAFQQGSEVSSFQPTAD